MEKYNISKVSRFWNISNELLRHYERLGLIEPERNENGYRFFNFKDIDRLLGIRRYRSMDFSLEDIDRLMNAADYTEVQELFQKSLENIRQKIAWYQELSWMTEKILNDWRQIRDDAGKCELTISQDILRVDLRYNDILNESISTEKISVWAEKLPVVFVSLSFRKEAILSGTKDVSLGYGVDIETFKRLGLPHIASEKYIRACKCVTTIIYSRSEEFIGAHSLRPVVDYCLKHGLTICGDAWGFTISTCVWGREHYRYHRVFVPVE